MDEDAGWARINLFGLAHMNRERNFGAALLIPLPFSLFQNFLPRTTLFFSIALTLFCDVILTQPLMMVELIACIFGSTQNG